jgi:hypothetical protein
VLSFFSAAVPKLGRLVREFSEYTMLRLFLAAAFVGTIAGCGQSEAVPVTGTVLLNGQPAANAEVIFTPTKGRLASGSTDASGRFTLSTGAPNDGAVPGDHKVTVVEYYPPGKPPPMTASGAPSRFPANYADTSLTPLKVTVERGAKNDFTLEVKK